MADTGSISGQVINIRNNQPIEGATVKVSGPTDGSTTTDPNGTFKVSNLVPGNDYRMDISADGFDPARFEDIVVLAGIDTDLSKLALEPQM
jgi:hypothetical protein